ncbi:MAG: DNA polymerase III subunit gamma/tau [Gammaproteobacteria bacterium]|nr:DNA polymerase III subunit gamma/tau [Gammaproteobacteria bacterium]
MSYQVLARKWRPRSFADMVGQGHVLKALINALDTGRLHHAYLFTGTRGVGKTTLARIVAKCLNCERGVSASPCGVCSACSGIDAGRFVDLIEVDAASRAKVDETRDLMDNVPYAPAAGRFKVYLIDEVHMFSNHSFNALLKTLEEPPPHVKFLLATTEPKKLPVTILSRCLQFNLKHLGADQIESQLRKIVAQEVITADEGSVRLLSQAAAGSMRDALSLLDQAISHGGGALHVAQVREMLGTIDSVELVGMLESLAAGDAGDLMARAARVAEYNPDYEGILADLIVRLHDIAVLHALPDGAALADADTVRLARMFRPEDVQLYYQVALLGRRDLATVPDLRIGFEMTLIRMLAFRPGGAVRVAAGAAQSARNSDPPAAVAEVKAHGTSTPGDSVPAGDWQQIIDEMSLAGLVRELAGHCMLHERTQDRVHLVLAPSQEHLLKTTQKERLQEALRTRFGPQLRLVITVEEPGSETPAERRAREEREQQAAALQNMRSDPNVQAMVASFDATLDESSVRPQR